MDRLLRTVVHEAGHAVGALAAGLGIRTVHVRPTPDGSARGACVTEGAAADLGPEGLTVFVAGDVAVELLDAGLPGPRAPSRTPLWYWQALAAREAAPVAAPGTPSDREHLALAAPDPATLAVATDLCRLRLRARWGSVQDLASQLLEHGQLSGARVHEIAGPPAPRASGARGRAPVSTVVRLLGEIDGATLSAFRRDLSRALASSAQRVVLEIDSPGGRFQWVPEVADEVFQARGGRRVVAMVNGRALGEAYAIAAQAHEVVVTPSGELGAVGIAALHTEFSRMEEAEGITRTLVVAGKHKDEWSAWRPLSDVARDHLQERVEDRASLLFRAVARGRGVAVEQVRQGFGEGRTFTARRAVDAGLADRVATLDQVLRGG